MQHALRACTVLEQPRAVFFRGYGETDGLTGQVNTIRNTVVPIKNRCIILLLNYG